MNFPKAMLLGLLSTLATGACYSQVPASGSTIPAQIALAHNREVKVTLRNGAPADMKNPAIQGDSLIGIDSYAKARIALAMSDVEKVEIRRRDTRRSVAGTVVTSVGVGFVLLFVLAASMDSGWD